MMSKLIIIAEALPIVESISIATLLLSFVGSSLYSVVRVPLKIHDRFQQLRIECFDPSNHDLMDACVLPHGTHQHILNFCLAPRGMGIIHDLKLSPSTCPVSRGL